LGRGDIDRLGIIFGAVGSARREREVKMAVAPSERYTVRQGPNASIHQAEPHILEQARIALEIPAAIRHGARRGFRAPARTHQEATMHKAVLPAALALSLALPSGAALAQDKPENLFTVRPAHLVAIGAGVVGGAIVGEAVLASELGALVGGVAGGYLAHVWFGGKQIELVLSSAPKN
jgi:hypothetical protein